MTDAAFQHGYMQTVTAAVRKNLHLYLDERIVVPVENLLADDIERMPVL